MKVPIVEKRVQVQTPRTKGVLANTPDAPRMVPGAFGEEIASAVKSFGDNLANEGGKFSAHLVAMQNQRNLDIGDDLANKYDDHLTQTLYEPQKIKDPKTGEEKEIGGWMNKQNYEVNGAYKEMTTYARTRRQQDLDQIKDNPTALRKYLERVEAIDRTHQKSVLSHEATEMRNGARNVFLSTINHKTNKLMPMDDAEREVEGAKLRAEIENGVTSGKITWDQGQNAGDQVWDQLFQADSVKYSHDEMVARVNSGYYKWSNAKSNDTALSALEHKKNLGDKQAENQKGYTRINLLKDMAVTLKSGESPIGIMRMAASKDSVVAQAMQKMLDSGMDYEPSYSDKENYAYSQATREMMDPKKSPTEIADYLLSETKNIMGSDVEKVTILFDAAARVAAFRATNDPKAKELDTAFKAVDSHVKQHRLPGDFAFSTFFKNLIGGKQPAEAAEIAKTETAKKVNPEGQKYVIGQVITNKAGESMTITHFDPRGIPMGKRTGKKATSNEPKPKSNNAK